MMGPKKTVRLVKSKEFKMKLENRVVSAKPIMAILAMKKPIILLKKMNPQFIDHWTKGQTEEETNTNIKTKQTNKLKG